MKKLLVIFSTFLIFGCDATSDWIEREGNKGTTLGYSQCLKDNKGKGLSTETVERLCIKQHNQRIFGYLNGRAGYDCDYGKCTFSGRIKNDFDEFVITKINIVIRHQDNKDDQGNIKDEVARSSQLWIEPGYSEIVYFRELEFQPESERIQDKSGPLYSWDVVEIEGIRIKLDQ